MRREPGPSAAVRAAIEFHRRVLAAGPVPCVVVGREARRSGIVASSQARARSLLDVEVVRGPDGVPAYKLP